MKKVKPIKKEKQLTVDHQKKVRDERFVRFQNILRNFRIVFRSIQAHSKRVEQVSGLTAAQLWMLWEMFNLPGMRVSELATVLSVHQSTCSNMLDKLQKKKLIYRDRSGPDQRVVRLYLTDKGTQLLANAPRPAQGALADVLLRLPDNVLDHLGSSLDTVVAALKVLEEDASMTLITE